MEGSFVGGGVALVEVETLFVGNFAGFEMEAGVLEARGSIEQPAMLGHADHEQVFGRGVGFVFFLESF